jgi:putative tricarboxylic transport membrane protein
MVWNPRTHNETTRSLGDSRVTFAEYKQNFVSIVRGSFIGVFLGSIPGIGAAPSAFLSYSEARRNSPNKENFGKGELEGVAAAEAGNNGVAGATLIPLLALGIPGDVITAIILGAFMIHGLQPGPLMFVRLIHWPDCQFGVSVFHWFCGHPWIQACRKNPEKCPVSVRHGALHLRGLWRKQ